MSQPCSLLWTWLPLLFAVALLWIPDYCTDTNQKALFYDSLLAPWQVVLWLRQFHLYPGQILVQYKLTWPHSLLGIILHRGKWCWQTDIFILTSLTSLPNPCPDQTLTSTFSLVILYPDLLIFRIHTHNTALQRDKLVPHATSHHIMHQHHFCKILYAKTDSQEARASFVAVEAALVMSRRGNAGPARLCWRQTMWWQGGYWHAPAGAFITFLMAGNQGLGICGRAG